MTEDIKQKWLALFDAMKKITDLEPWKHFDETPCIIYDREDGKKMFMHIIGAQSKFKGSICYIGRDSFDRNLYCAAEAPEFITFMQNNVFSALVDRKDVGKQNYALIKELGLNFRGKGSWLTVTRCYERREPCIPDIDEIDELTEIYKTYYDILKSAIYSSKVFNVDDAIAFYAKKDKNNKWSLSVTEYIPEGPDTALDYSDEGKLKGLRTRIPTQNTVLVIEDYSPQTKTDTKSGINYYPLYIRFIDNTSRSDIYSEEFDYKISREKAFASAVVNYIEKYQKPKRIVTDNDFTARFLEPICKNQGIKLDVEEITGSDTDNDIFNELAAKLYAEFEAEQQTERKNKRKKRSRKKSNTVYTISVSLFTGLYRHIKISGDDTLHDLHLAIQDAFEFDDDHLYAFFTDNKAWSKNSFESPYAEHGRSADKYNIYEVLEEKQKFLYIFDFGDCWHFNCKVLKIEGGIQKNAEVVRAKGENPPQYPEYDYSEDYDEDDFDEDDFDEDDFDE